MAKSQCIIALLDIHTGITQIPSQLTWHFLYILLQDTQDSVCVTFHWVLLVEFGENEWAVPVTYIIALFDIHTGITQITSQLTIKLEWILLQDDHDSVLLTFTGFYCRIWEENRWQSVTIHYSTPWHSYRHYSNPSQLTWTFFYTVLLQDTQDLSVLLFTGFYCRIWEKMNGSLSQYIIALFDIHTGITQIPSQLTINWNEFFFRMTMTLCVLTFTGFYCRIWEKMNGSLSRYIIALLDIHTGHYSNSFTVNMTFSIHSSSGHPSLCLC